MATYIRSPLQDIDLPAGYTAACDDDGIIIASVDRGFCIMRWVIDKNEHVANAKAMLRYLQR